MQVIRPFRFNSVVDAGGCWHSAVPDGNPGCAPTGVSGPGASSRVWMADGGSHQQPIFWRLSESLIVRSSPTKKEKLRNEILVWIQRGNFEFTSVASGSTLLAAIKLSVNSDQNHFSFSCYLYTDDRNHCRPLESCSSKLLKIKRNPCNFLNV